MLLLNDTLYVGGSFATVAATARLNAVAININGNGGAIPYLRAWSLAADSSVLAMSLLNNSLYVGGAFRFINGTSRNSIAEVDLEVGAPTSWNPNATGSVVTILATTSKIYAAGVFSTIGSSSSRRLTGLDPVTGLG